MVCPPHPLRETAEGGPTDDAKERAHPFTEIGVPVPFAGKPLSPNAAFGPTAQQVETHFQKRERDRDQGDGQQAPAKHSETEDGPHCASGCVCVHVCVRVFRLVCSQQVTKRRCWRPFAR